MTETQVPTEKKATGLNFGEAFLALKGGQRVSRAAWSQQAEGQPPKYGHWLKSDIAGEQEVFVQVGQGSINTYNVNQIDLHANDWVIL